MPDAGKLTELDVGTPIDVQAEEQLLQVYHTALIKWGETNEHLELEANYTLKEIEESEGDEGGEGGDMEVQD